MRFNKNRRVNYGSAERAREQYCSGLNRLPKTSRNGEEVTNDGEPFHTRAAATGNARFSVVSRLKTSRVESVCRLINLQCVYSSSVAIVVLSAVFCYPRWTACAIWWNIIGVGFATSSILPVRSFHCGLTSNSSALPGYSTDQTTLPDRLPGPHIHAIALLRRTRR